MAARNFASPAEVLLHRSPEGGPLSSLLCCPRTPIDERQRNAEHRLNLSNAEVFTDSSAHHENCPLQANHAPWPKAMTEMASGSETEKKPAKAMSYTSYPMMPGISEGATSVAATSMRESENETEVMSKEMNESQSNLSESREDPSTSSPQKKDTKGYFGLGKMSIDNIEGIGAKIKTGLGLKAIVKQTEKFSTGEMLKQQTDDASFKQFLALVMKANLDTDNDDEKSLFTNVTSGKESKKIMPCGLFPRTQMVLSQCCELIVSSWVCHFLSFAFLVLHCIGLVLVINHATVRPELWRGLSTGYFVFFLMELLVRWVGEKQSGWILFDVFLALLCILEAILPLTTIPVGQGQFTVLALRLLRVVRRLQFVPRESKAAIASFGLLPAGVVLLVCVIWSFLAVIWFLILDTSDITSSSGNATIGRLGGRTGNRTQDPLVIAVPQFQNYGSAWLTQLYLAGKGMNWRRITDGISGSTLNADVLRLSFVLLLVLVSLVTTNAMIVLVYELAEASSADFQLKIEAELVRKRLFGLHSLEEKLMAGIESREEEFTMLDRTTLEKSLVLADEELKAQGITADELLQLFDHLLESSTSTGVMISELLFGVLLLTAPAGEADNLQVDYLQKKCIEITDAANGNLQNLMNQSRLMLDTMEVNFSALQAHLSKLRSSARKTAKEVKQNMLKVEAQIEECARSVDGISQLRKVQLSVAMQKARLEIQERLERSKMTASQLDSFNSLSRVFGFPALSGKASMPQIEAVQHLLPPERAVEAVQQRQMSERERQFQLAAALLRAEVKDRLEKKLQHHFQSTADDQDEGQRCHGASLPQWPLHLRAVRVVPGTAMGRQEVQRRRHPRLLHQRHQGSLTLELLCGLVPSSAARSSRMTLDVPWKSSLRSCCVWRCSDATPALEIMPCMRQSVRQVVLQCQWLPVIVTCLYLHFSSSGFSLQQVRYGTQALQQGDLVKPDGSTNYRGVVMLIHGGFWKASYDRSLMIEIADDLVAQNFCVWNVDYRSVGSGGGYPETFEDLHAALSWLGSPAAATVLPAALPVAVVGHSAGGHLATWLGLQEAAKEAMFPEASVTPKVVISQAGVLDLVAAYEAHLGQGAVRDFLGSSVPSTSSQLLAASRGAFLDLLGGCAPDAAQRFAKTDPKQLLHSLATEKLPTFVLVHGQQDDIVPPEQSRKFYEAFQEALPKVGRAKCVLKEVPGEAHFEHLRTDSKLWSAAANCAAVRLLLENSAEPNDRCLALDNGEFPLQLALSSNLVRSPERLQMVELLLEARADVGQRRNDPEGHTPLHDGVRRGDPGVVLLLLRHGADPNVTNAFGEAPLELAVRGSFYTDARESLALVETLIQWGACPVLPGQGCKRVKKRDFLERVKLPLQPSLQQVIGVLHRVDPALGNLAETVSKVWGVLQTQLAEQRCLESSDLCDGNLARTGTLLLHLFALGRLKCSGFQLPSAAIPLVSAAPELAEAARYTRLAVASYGANVLALVGLLQFWDAWPPAGPDRDKAAAARYLQLPPEKMLACGTKMPKKKQDAKSKFDSFKPWWVLIEDQDELILSIRGSANIDDIATDLACATCDFLDGYAHEGMAGAVAAVWEEANVKVLMLGKIVMMEKKKAIHAGDYKRFVVCGHSLGGSVSLLLGMKLRAESSLPLEVHAFAAGPAPCFQGGSTVHLEKGLISVINRFDPVPHLSLDAALRMILAAERLAEAGLSWQQTLSLVAPLRIPGEAIWLVDACAGRQMLPVALPPEDLQRFCQELPEISVAQSALDHVMSTYVYNMDKAAKRLEESDGSDDDEGSSDRIEPA
eukprot:symbB.v1.2.020741.t2/scaffold1762.1/size182224/8